jgi:hypothetical protein
MMHMAYKLRFVQKFVQGKTDAFIELEKKFMALEKEIPAFPKGKRFLPCFSKEPLNTLIWECEFATLEDTVSAQQFLENNGLHKDLFDQQVQYFIESYAEIYKTLEE